MPSRLVPPLVVALLLTACASDGIPSVDDPLHPEVDGEAMSSVQFLQQYCGGENINSTCRDVRNAVAESLRSTVPADAR